jgi:hypothetical protein
LSATIDGPLVAIRLSTGFFREFEDALMQFRWRDRHAGSLA